MSGCIASVATWWLFMVVAAIKIVGPIRAEGLPSTLLRQLQKNC